MPTITSIKPQKFKGRVNIYLDDEFIFGIDLENFVKLGLKVGQVYSREEVERIIKKAEYQKVLDKLLRFATLRPRSEHEIETWFKKHKVAISLHTDLKNKLIKLELLDDEKFAKWWVEQRLQFKFKSKRELKEELKNKGIKGVLIDRVISESEVDEVKIAKDLVEKKMYLWKRLDKFSKKRKMTEFLLRKGYSWEVIKKVVNVYDINYN